ncbi:hypothetical protein HS1genome_0092 [Sulfodiicoccus acidiphilus]|uniref:Uncharacterized protein n=1 Tax=Sulfodiicoccus acidiphilus TaxID=1670455 RepID=A0A348B0K1_9CREN|nr:hypothetical protein HS1genome_0092 [Sulfodiicoccus acidiphilus]GGT86488.1 hypothetical protein GCM10007116_00540 [Sulfodiicoccus acidiphilus]
MIPVIGPPLSGFLIGRETSDFTQALKYVAFSLPFSALGALFLYLGIPTIQKYLYAILIYSLATPFIISFMITTFYNKVELTYDEDTLEIRLWLKNIDPSFDPNTLFKMALDMALRKIRNPYYKSKIKTVMECPPLRVRVNQDGIVMRKNCNGIVVEATVVNDKAKIKVSIPY